MQLVILPDLVEELLEGLRLVDIVLASRHLDDLLGHLTLLDDVIPLSRPRILQRDVDPELMLRPLHEGFQRLLV